MIISFLDILDLQKIHQYCMFNLLQVCARLEILMVLAGLALSNFGIKHFVNRKCPNYQKNHQKWLEIVKVEMKI